MTSDTSTGTASDTLMRAMLALQIADRDERLLAGEPRRTELVLADAGISLPEIVALTGRKYEAVKTAVRRAREAEAKPKAKTTRKARSSDD